MTPIQRTVFRLIATKQGWAEFGDLLSTDTFQDPLSKRLYDLWTLAHARSSSDLDANMVSLSAQAIYGSSDELAEATHEIFVTPEVDRETAKRLVADYTSREAAMAAASHIISRARSPEFDANVALDIISRAVALDGRRHSHVCRYAETPLPGESVDRPGLCALGLSPQLDALLGGGVAAGELLVFAGLPSSGKSSVLCAVGANIARAGKSVLHLTLEISDRRVTRRYDSALTGLSVQDMCKMAEKVREAREKDDVQNRILIEDWAFKDVPSIAVRGCAERARADGDKIEAIIVDYMKEMSINPSSGRVRMDQWQMYGLICRQLRQVAKQLNVPILTAWQINRAGSTAWRGGRDAPPRDLDRDMMAESWGVVERADIILALNRNPHDEELKQMRVQILKQRDNTNMGITSPIINLHCDMDRCQIHEKGPGHVTPKMLS